MAPFAVLGGLFILSEGVTPPLSESGGRGYAVSNRKTLSTKARLKRQLAAPPTRGPCHFTSWPQPGQRWVCPLYKPYLME